MERKISCILAVFIVIVMMAVFTTGSSAATLDISDVGSAVTGDTVVIKNSDDWLSFVSYTGSASGEGITFLITANINVANSASGSVTFSGTVTASSGVVITASVPMFKKFAGTAMDLVLTGAIGSEVEAFSGHGAAVAADITGSARFENIVSDVDVCATSAAGGIAANSTATGAAISFVDCTNNGNIITTSTGMPAAGIFAYCYDSATSNATSVTFTRCSNTGEISNERYLAGGIMGYLKGGSPSAFFYSCSNSGDVLCPNNTAGGILGFQYKSAGTPNLVFSGCTNSGNVYAKTNAGGICGYANTISRYDVYNDGAGNKYGCSNSGTITSTTDKAGGILANTIAECFFEGCVNSGSINGYTYAGGICGYSLDSCTFTKASVSDKFGCLNSGAITSANGSAGGILARQDSSAKTGTIISCVNLANITGKGQVGGISGWIVGTTIIDNCINGSTTDNITVKSTGAYAGGITGRACAKAGLTATISNCINYAQVQSYELGTGGVIGYSSAVSMLYITDCQNYGTITNLDNPVCGTSTSAMKTHMLGGIAGRIHNDITITGCMNYGNIIAKNYDGGFVSNYSGGIAGYVASEGIAVITGCYNSGSVTGPSLAPSSSLRAGGIAGWLQGTKTASAEYAVIIEDCYNTGTVTNTQYAGGIAGQLGVSGTTYGRAYVNNCINAGRITSSLRAGGIIGFAAGANTTTPYISNCVNFGSVYGTGIAAGIAAYCDSPNAVLTGNYAFGGTLVSENNRYALYYNTVVSTGEKTGNAFSSTYADFLCYENGNVIMDSGYTDITDKFGTGELAIDLDTILNAAGFYTYIEWFLEASTTDLALNATYKALYNVDEYTEYDIKRAYYSAKQKEPDTGDATIYVVLIMAVTLLSFTALIAVKRKRTKVTDK